MRLTANRLALLLIVYFIGLATLYMQAMPPFEAADEAEHFLYVHHLLEEGRLPRIASRDDVADASELVKVWANESHQPPLYYAIGALLVGLTQRDNIEAYLQSNDLIFIRGIPQGNHHKWMHNPTAPGDNTGTAITVLRLYSVVLGAGTLYLIYRTTLLAFGRVWMGLLALLFVASIPTFVSISASINNDNLVTFLYAAGVYLCVLLWREGITNERMIALSAALAAIALAKVTGLSLFGIVYLSLLIGVWRGYYSWRDALKVLVVSLVFAALFAGWWYIRNWSLYGDPLALDATQSVWGREYEIAATSGDAQAELLRIWRSFWAMVGHLHWPVYGPDWVFGYAAVITIVGSGLVIVLRDTDRYPPTNRTVLVGAHSRAPLRDNGRGVRENDIIALFTLTCITLIVMLLYGTRSVDISYGRLLFPALVGFAPLMIYGWGRFAVLMIAPLTVLTLIFPVKYIGQAYAPLQVVDAVPSDAVMLNVQVESLELIAYERLDKTIIMGGSRTAHTTAAFALYIRGQHPDDLALRVAGLHKTTMQPLGQIEVYPGMAQTSHLNPDVIYRVPVHLRVGCRGEACFAPTVLAAELTWFSPYPYRDIPMRDGAGTALDTLLIDLGTWLDPDYAPMPPDNKTAVTYGDLIRLEGYSVFRTGDEIRLTLYWRGLQTMTQDWTVAVQLIDADGQILAQADGMPPGYPTSAWIDDTLFTDTRLLPNIDGAASILVGWYDANGRLAAGGDVSIQADLAVLPLR